MSGTARVFARWGTARKGRLLEGWLVLWVSLVFPILWGCGSPARPQPTDSPFITLSPNSVLAGSSDLKLTITGTNFAGAGACRTCAHSVVAWSANGRTTALATTFVSSSKLSAIVPAALLSNPIAARVFVETVIGQEDSPRSKTMPAIFAVTTVVTGPATITSISPSSAPAGSGDLTLTITGSNFKNDRLQMSVAAWTSSPTDSHCCNTWLETTFVSSEELVAVIPANLLKNPVAARVFVEIGDPMGMSDGVTYPKTNSVVFDVTP